MRGNEKEFKETRLVIVLLAVIIILLFGIIILLLARGDKPEPIPEPNKVENKDKKEQEEKDKKESTKEDKSKKEKKSVSIDLEDECINSESSCTKDYELTNNDIKITIKTEMDYGKKQIVIINEKNIYENEINDYSGPFHINGIALLDNNMVVIDVYNPGYSSNGSHIRYYYDGDSNFEMIKEIKSTINEFDYDNPSIIESKEGKYHTCEVRTCDDQTEKTYSYKINDNKSITTKLEKEENKFCSAQC